MRLRVRERTEAYGGDVFDGDERDPSISCAGVDFALVLDARQRGSFQEVLCNHPTLLIDMNLVMRLR